MIEAFLSGVLLGLTMAIMLGPALFSLLQTSIDRGFRSGMHMAFGIFASDFLLVALSYLGVSAFFTAGENTLYIGIIGGIVMILFGLFTFRKKNPVKTNIDVESSKPDQVENPSPLKFMAKGFALNILNPFLLIFWMGWMAYVSNTFDHVETIIFFSGCLITVLSTDLLKCFIAGKIKQYLKPKVILILNYILGAVLILLGVYMILRVTYFEKPEDAVQKKPDTELTIPLNH